MAVCRKAAILCVCMVMRKWNVNLVGHTIQLGMGKVRRLSFGVQPVADAFTHCCVQVVFAQPIRGLSR